MIPSFDDGVGYGALYLACAFSGLGVPMPEDVPVLYAGIALSHGDLQLLPTILVVSAGVLTRDVLAWSIGRFLGHRLLESRWFQKLVAPEKIERARHLLGDHGPVAVMAGRFMVGFRAPMFIAAGASRIPLPTFVMWDALGGLVALPAVMALGYFFGDPVIDVVKRVLPGTSIVWGALAALVLAGWMWRRKKKKAAGQAG